MEPAASPHRTRRARIWGWIWAHTLRAIAATWRESHEGLQILEELRENCRPHIMAFWHRKFITLFPILRGNPICVVTATSATGDVIAEMSGRFGYSHIQIPGHGSDRSLQLMENELAHSIEAAIAVDGPHGPYHVVKRGAIQAASGLGYLAVPVSVASRKKIVISHRWDRLEIPFPFTRVSLVVGEPICVPPGLTRDDLSIWTQRLHDALEELDERANRRSQSLGDSS